MRAFLVHQTSNVIFSIIFSIYFHQSNSRRKCHMKQARVGPSPCKFFGSTPGIEIFQEFMRVRCGWNQNRTLFSSSSNTSLNPFWHLTGLWRSKLVAHSSTLRIPLRVSDRWNTSVHQWATDRKGLYSICISEVFFLLSKIWEAPLI